MYIIVLIVLNLKYIWIFVFIFINGIDKFYKVKFKILKLLFYFNLSNNFIR